MLKAEIGDYAGTNTNRDGELNQLLSNKQKWLASRYDWPFLEHRWDVAVTPALQYQQLPTTTQDVGITTTAINFERPVHVEVFWNDVYTELKYGIGLNELNWMNFDLGQQTDPIQRWRLADQIVVATPSAVLFTQTGGGTLPVGSYTYAVSFVTAYGEGPLSPTATNQIDSTPHSMEITNIPTGADYVLSRRLYRSKVGTTTPLYLLTEITDNTTTTYSDSAADSTLTEVWAGEEPLYVPRFEVWPVPVTAQTIRFTGQRALIDMVEDDDVCDLDDMLLVYFVAGEKLMRSKQADAQLKMQMAEERLRMLRSTYPCREEKYVLGGSDADFYRDRKLTGMIIVR